MVRFLRATISDVIVITKLTNIILFHGKVLLSERIHVLGKPGVVMTAVPVAIVPVWIAPVWTVPVTAIDHVPHSLS